jgi:hypothetical protein
MKAPHLFLFSLMSTVLSSDLSITDPADQAAAGRWRGFPSFPESKDVVPPAGVPWVLPDEDAVQALRMYQNIQSFTYQLSKGSLLTNEWSDLGPLIRTDTKTGNPYRILWLLGHTSAVMDFSNVSAEDSQSSWEDLWEGVVPGPFGHENFIDDFSPMTTQIMTAAALKYGRSYPSKMVDHLSMINKAASILVACLLPLKSNTYIPNDLVLPGSMIHRVREWLLDTLENCPYSYANQNRDSSRLDPSHLASRSLYVVGRPGEALPHLPKFGARPIDTSPPISPIFVSRDELSWALDNAVAVRLKQWARTSTISLDSHNQIRDFLKRLSFWPEASAALDRTKGLINRWPNPMAVYLDDDTVEPRTISELVCAMTNMEGWPALIRQSNLVPKDDSVLSPLSWRRPYFWRSRSKYCSFAFKKIPASRSYPPYRPCCRAICFRCL